ncbi:MAG: Wzz/FepE/Etk N-terminal domain-containing protein [Armatimonadetes bacterium]|nr:Wzz/FepE/Etk N-terminal domain-containing protein [Armatimonadota bacterium]
MSSALPTGWPPDPVRRLACMLIKRRWLALLTFVGVALLAGLAAYLAPPRYTSSATLYVQAESPRLDLFSELSPGRAAASPSVETLIGTVAELVKSRTLAEELAAAGDLPEPEHPRSLRARLHSAWQAATRRLANPLGGLGLRDSQLPDPSREAVSELQANVTAEMQRNTELLRVTVTNERPERAQQLCNALVEALLKRIADYSRQEYARMYSSVEAELPALQRKLAQADERLQDYKTANQLLNIEDETLTHIRALAQLQADLEATQHEAAQTARRQVVVDAQLAEQAQYAVSSRVVDNNPVAEELRKRLYALEASLAQTTGRLTEAHPEVTQLKRQIDQTRDQLKLEAQRVVASETTSLDPVHQSLAVTAATLHGDLQGLRAREAALAATLRTHEDYVRQLPTHERRLAELQVERDIADTVYRNIAARADELAFLKTNASSPLSVFIVDPASLPRGAAGRPAASLLAILIPFSALMLALVAALVAEYFDSSLRDASEVEEVLRIPCLAELPLITHKERRDSTHGDR